MQNQKVKYNVKWVITYKGKAYMSVYGKKRAYELYVRLSHCMSGLGVEPAPRRGEKRTAADIAAYNRQWRANNPDKVKAYNRRSYLKRRMNMQAEGQGMLTARRAQDLQEEIRTADNDAPL